MMQIWLGHLRQFISSTTVRLVASYLAIIMLMSIGFSLVFYNTSSYQLGRQLPPNSLLQPNPNGYQNPGVTQSGQSNQPNTNPAASSGSQGELGQFLQSRIEQGRTALRWRLVYLNLAALVLGGVLSYYLARRTLKPIEESMEAQARFVNDASHELRTPITAIRTSNDVALRNRKLTLVQAKQVIRQNTNDLERLKELSEGLLTLAKQDQSSMQFSEVGLQEIASRAMTQIVPQAIVKGVAVHDEVANVHVHGNKAALEQVLVILLDNAVKYSNSDGNVYLKTRRRGKYIYLDVVDEGMGIRASDLPHLFRRFYRADHSRVGGGQSGYGLGLSIARRIMEAHGSEITVTSRLGQGSTFTLKLALMDH